MQNYQKSLGNLGEKIAGKYLHNHGYKILASNFTIQGGQIDLVTQFQSADHPLKIIFFEIKTRTNQSFGTAEEIISRNQKKALLYTAQIFLANHQLFHSSWQFDLISINLNLKLHPPLAKIQHISNIFGE